MIDLDSGRIRWLGPGAEARATWPPALGGRYAVWFETADPGRRGAEVIAYDTERGRRWPVARLGDVYSLAAVSGDVAVWCTADPDGEPRVAGLRIASEEPLELAPEYGVPVVSGDLVVWGRGTTGPFTARELSTGRTRPVAAGGLGGELTAYALAGRDLAWGQLEGSGGRVAVVDVDTGATRVLASGVPGLVGPAFDGTTVVWVQAASGSSAGVAAGTSAVMGRRLDGGATFEVATVEGRVTEVAVSGGTVAWLATVRGAPRVETKELPR
jgi:predicted small integral membrane protein